MDLKEKLTKIAESVKTDGIESKNHIDVLNKVQTARLNVFASEIKKSREAIDTIEKGM